MAVSEHAGRIEVTGGDFEPVSEGFGVLRLLVAGRNLRSCGSPLLARVGSLPVQSIRIAPGGHGFTGVLRTAPHAGDRLYVRYAGGREIETNVVYRAPQEPPLVA